MKNTTQLQQLKKWLAAAEKNNDPQAVANFKKDIEKEKNRARNKNKQ